MPGASSHLWNLEAPESFTDILGRLGKAGITVIQVWSGALDLVVEGRGVLLPTSGFLFLPPGMGFTIQAYRPATKIIVGWFHPRVLRAHGVTPWSAPLLERATTPMRCVVPARIAGELRGLAMRSMMQHHPDEVRLADELTWLYRSWMVWHADGHARDPDTMHPAVREVLQMIIRDPVGIQLRQAAQKAGLSYGRLAVLMKEQTGMSLTTQRSHARIRALLPQVRACWRWRLTDMAKRAGFGSYSHFHRVFRQVTGMAPADWLRQHRHGGPATDGVGGSP